MNMLLYDARIVHRPEHMMKEVDALTRFNRKFEELQEDQKHSPNAYLLQRYNKRAAWLLNNSIKELHNNQFDSIAGLLTLKSSPVRKAERNRCPPIEYNIIPIQVVGDLSDPKTEL